MCQDSGVADVKPQLEDRKPKKRKSEEMWSSSQKKGKGITEMMDTDSESDNSDEYVNEDENTVNSNSTNEDIEGRESSVSQNEFASDMELSGMDPTDALAQDNRHCSDMDNSNDGDVDEIIRFVTTYLLHNFIYVILVLNYKSCPVMFVNDIAQHTLKRIIIVNVILQLYLTN